MNYKKEYDYIIEFRLENRLEKSKDQYTELHHITPKSLGGSNDVENLVRLTGEEHYNAHYFLFKYYQKEFKNTHEYKVTINCFNAMNMYKDIDENEIHINANLYQEIKEARIQYFKDKFLKYIEEICKFIDNNGKNPSINSVYLHENNLGRKLRYLKQTKNNKEKIFYKDYQLLAEELNHKDLFNKIDYKQNGIDLIVKICEFKNKYNRNPYSNSKNIYERKLGNKLIKIKQGKMFKGNNIWYDEYQEIVEGYGYNNLFQTYEEKALTNTKNICDFINKYNRNPHKESTDNYEKKLGMLFSSYKENRKNDKMYDSCIEISKEKGLPNLFNTIIENRCNDIENICKFIDKHGKNPNEKSINIVEKTLGIKLSNFKKSISSGVELEDIYKEKINSLGYPDLFIIKNKEYHFKNSMIKLKEIVLFIKTNKTIPNQKSEDDIEKKLGVKLCTFKISKRTGKGWDDRYQEYLEKVGYDKLLERKWERV